MQDQELDAFERRFVDAMAVVYEQRGLSPVAGRILGRLLVARPPEQSSKELARYTEASKGSVSDQTQLLVRAGYVERLRRKRSRETWYRIRGGIWVELLQREAEAAGHVRGLADAVIDAQEAAGVVPSEALRAYRDVNGFFERRLPSLIDEWTRERDGSV